MQPHTSPDFARRDTYPDEGKNKCCKSIGYHFIFFNLKFHYIGTSPQLHPVNIFLQFRKSQLFFNFFRIF